MTDHVKLPVELNIRGVGGATATEILGVADERQVKPVLVDEQAGFYRLVDDPHTDRIKEAYEWGRLTSGGATHSIWWILLPFTLLNVAGWMFRPLRTLSSTESGNGDPPPPGAPEPTRSLLWWGRLLVVFGGLALTALYVLWLAVIFLEMIAVDCYALGSCAEPWYLAPLGWFNGDLGWRLALGTFLTAFCMFMLLRFILATQRKLEGWEHDDVYRFVSQQDVSRLRRNTDLDDMRFWYKWEEHRRLLRWHVGAISAVLGSLLGYAFGRFSDQELVTEPATWVGCAILAVLVVAALRSATAPEARGATSPGRYETVRSPRTFWTLSHLGAGGVAAVVAFSIARTATGDTLSIVSGIRWASTLLFWLAIALWVVIGVRYYKDHGIGAIGEQFRAAYRKTLGSSKHGAGPNREAGFRWAGPVVAAALALYVMGAGFGALTHVIGRGVIGLDAVSDPRYNTSLVDVLAVSLVVVVVVAYVAYRRGRKDDQGVLDDYWPPDKNGLPTAIEREASLTEREAAWRKKVRRMRFLAKAGQEADRNLTLLVIVMMVLQVAQILYVEGFNARFWSWDLAATTAPLFGWEWAAPLHTVASWGIVLFLFPGIWLIRQAFRDRESRRQFAKVWDVVSFWPRRFHPLAAPCYAERAVPEVRNRIKQLINAGHRVIISAHSQGTVIAFAALMQISGEERHVPIEVGRYTIKSYGDADWLRNIEGSLVSRGSAPGETPSPAPQVKQDTAQQIIVVEATDDASYAAAPSVMKTETKALRKVSLVTFGCPLTTLYGFFFPRYFGRPGRFEALRIQLQQLDDGYAWNNFFRKTDYIGREVFVEPGGVLTAPDAGLADVRILEAGGKLFPAEKHSNYEYHEALERWFRMLAAWSEVAAIRERDGTAAE